MMRRVWNERRAQNGDQYIKHIMVLQRCVATHRFVSCVNQAVRVGKKARATRAAKTALTQQLKAAATAADVLDPEDYVGYLVEHNITPAQLEDMTPEHIYATGVKTGDALRLHAALKKLQVRCSRGEE